MIPVSKQKVQSLSWQTALQSTTTSIKEVSSFCGLSSNDQQILAKLSGHFPLKIPISYLEHIKTLANPLPVLKQFIPTLVEYEQPPEDFVYDPLQENSSNPLPGLIHKYKTRALLTITQQCAVHCRYCFRRHFDYRENNPGKSGWLKVFEYILADKNINEVIFSGGDPLSVSDKYLAWFIDQINQLPQIKIIRFHTRLPVIIPERITADLLKILNQARANIVFVFHINHPDEITNKFKQQTLSLKQSGYTLLNQSVLLKDINDKADTLVTLSYALFENKIIPYYLHQLDPVIGAHHFQVSENHAKSIMKNLQANLPGFLVPKLVRENPNRHAKTIIM